MAPSRTSPPAIPVRDVRAGDLLLSLGEGNLSALLAWNGDSAYSHAALVLNDGNLIEATTRGVSISPVADRPSDAKIVFTDVYRPVTQDGNPRTVDEMQTVASFARQFDQLPYAMDSLKQLAIFVSVRNHIPKDPMARWIIRVALDHLDTDDRTSLTCTELIYRSFDEAPTSPANALRPVIVVQPRRKLPFPKIDWIALRKEIRPMLRGSKSAQSTKTESADTDPGIEPQVLKTRMRNIRRKLDAGPSTSKSGERNWIHPNPSAIGTIPLDFETSPSFRVLGRLRD